MDRIKDTVTTGAISRLSPGILQILFILSSIRLRTLNSKP